MRQSGPEPHGPRRGVTVIDFSWVYAGPFATRMLAYYGATVIRLESQTRPDQVRSSGLARIPGDDGPEASQQWHSINADKLSLQLNLKVPESRQVVLDLVAEADERRDLRSAGEPVGAGLRPGLSDLPPLDEPLPPSTKDKPRLN